MSHKKKWRSMIAAFLIGFFAGIAVLNLVLGYQLDRLNLINEQLHQEIARQQEKITRFEKELAQAKRKFIVQNIKVQVKLPEKADDPDLKNKIEGYIEKNLLKDLMWREVKTLDPFLVHKIIHNRNIKIDRKDILLKVTSLLISETISVYVEAEIQKTPVPSVDVISQNP